MKCILCGNYVSDNRKRVGSILNDIMILAKDCYVCGMIYAIEKGLNDKEIAWLIHTNKKVERTYKKYIKKNGIQ